MTFDTDATDDYFGRVIDPGEWDVRLLSDAPSDQDEMWGMVESSSMRLSRGKALLSINVKDPEDGDAYRYELSVYNRTTLTRFTNEFTLKFMPKQPPAPPAPPPAHYKLPEMSPVGRDAWTTMSPPFVETTAVRVYANGTDNEGRNTYDWFWNEDNAALLTQTRHAAKSRRTGEVKLIRDTFAQAMLLTGLSALRTHERMQRQHQDIDEVDDRESLPSAADFVAHATSAFAPVAWHIIQGLSCPEELEDDDD